MDEKLKQQISIFIYLDVEPCKDYWYADVELGMWVVSRADGKNYQKPIRPEDYITTAWEGGSNNDLHSR